MRNISLTFPGHMVKHFYNPFTETENILAAVLKPLTLSHRYWPFGQDGCAFHGFQGMISVLASISFMAAIAWDRYHQYCTSEYNLLPGKWTLVPGCSERYPSTQQLMEVVPAPQLAAQLLITKGNAPIYTTIWIDNWWSCPKC